MSLLRATLLSCLLLPFATSGLAAGETARLSTPDGGHYHGDLRGGRFHGQGTLEWDSGASYRGGFEDGVMSGQGRLVLPDGRDYQGTFRNGALNGEGRLTLPDGTLQEGWFRHGLLHGQGRASGPDGRYEGAFRDGRYSGRGELQLPDGSRYSGDFESGRFHGRGHYESADREVYDGDFVRGEFTGKGVFRSPDGAHYEGEFLRWRPHGAGRYSEAGGRTIEARFENGEPLGTGRIVDSDGSDYRGEIAHWQAEGNGVLKLPDGDVYSGGFAAGSFEGRGVMRYARPRDGQSRVSGIWRSGELVDSPAIRERRARLESVLYTESQRLDAALDALAPQVPGKVDMYLLTLAGDGSQEVFRRETEFVRRQFDRDYGTAGRSLSLANSRTALGTLPLASTTSLRRALAAIAARMDRDEDVLFLYLSSHGSPQHTLAINQSDFDLPDLSASELAEMLRDSGIRWKVVVISACYSGGFIDALRDPGTLLIAAAREDRRSFGCADENDFTYFGRAFFKDALPASRSFEEAFRKAERLVRARELELFRTQGDTDEGDFSLPQMSAPGEIGTYLRRWWAARRPVPPRSMVRDGVAERPGRAGYPPAASASPSFSMR